MLEHLFGSRTRVKLLGLFLRHPDEPLFVREITRRIDTQINAVRRELTNLVRLGLIAEKEAKAEQPGERPQPGLKKKFYQVNASFVLLPELTGLIVKAQILLEKRFDQELTKLGDIHYLALLGLFLGKPSPAPVDVFIVGKIDKGALERFMAETEKQLGLTLNFSCMTVEEYHYRKEIMDRFLHGILESPKNVVINRLGEHV